MLNVLFVLGYLFLLGYIFTVLKRNRGKLLTEDEIQINSKWITTASLLAALTAILHSAPVFFPVIGLALSPLSSIPIIIGALLFADRVLPMFLAATVLLFLINVQEAMIFLLATGPLGLATTLTVVPTIPFWQKSLIPTSLLTCGILLLVFLAGVPGLQNIVGTLNVTMFLAIVLLSFLYSLLFMGITLFSQKRMVSMLANRRKGKS